MQFEPLTIAGAMRVRIEPHTDHRGFFARTFCTAEFARAGLPTEALQASISYNAKLGTVRGMHFQWPPSHEGKLVRCLRGKLFDVLIDLRPDSATYLQHQGLLLDQDNRAAVFIPAGVAHGFQTLTDHTEVLYQMTDVHAPDLAGGVRWNDPMFGIPWPLGQPIIAERDAGYPDFDRARFETELRHRKGIAVTTGRDA
ncbi:dTDP-4-dehydrorhamnose 3,5-epimerase [Steroidobacter denitrificans]|uniref:dTDP-4-dehydrorhamnose 3,5-epimerase n=1 Tax=Steroidobacter denitrificans TaxID=465721 RepID=A0A127FCX3_STEDE|nr:dTDP-4-dehydrorhamnose 3,5-epimerase [Steroidobacter denitrificans]AMN47438.1 dTDP-4-dehydrorhamnose 3,5-epimerase [Steroidobacter denitrificans]